MLKEYRHPGNCCIAANARRRCHPKRLSVPPTQLPLRRLLQNATGVIHGLHKVAGDALSALTFRAQFGEVLHPFLQFPFKPALWRGIEQWSLHAFGEIVLPGEPILGLVVIGIA